MNATIIIVGAGQAAAQAIASLRQDGHRGRILVYGDEPYLPYQRPPLSKKYLMGELARDRLELRPQAFYEKNEVTLKLGLAVTAIDRAARRVRLSDGGTESYDQLLIATGARVRKVSLPGADLKNIFYLRSIADADAIRPLLQPGRPVSLVGGGYIGLEIAAVAAHHGCKVTVLELADRVMSRVVSEAVSDFFEAEHRKAGVTLKLGAAVEAFEGDDRGVSCVRLSDGARVAAECAIVGVGVVPNVELAQAAGLPCPNGIEVDDCGRTADPAIFAAGDCTCHPNPYVGGMVRLESVQNAIDQSRHAALAMLNRPTPYQEVPWFWSDQYDLKLQIAGIRAAGDELVLRGDPAERSFAVFHLRGGAINAVEAVNAPMEYMVGRKLIGLKAQVPIVKLADKSVPMKSLG